MRRLKYILRKKRGEAVIGIRYTVDEGELLVGGPARFRKEMLSVVAIFGVDRHDLKFKWSGARVTIKMEISQARWDDHFKELGLHFEIEDTRNFRRLMG